MTKLISLVVIVVFCGVASGVKVTFNKFYDVPLTRGEAELGGYRSISGTDCRNNGQFEGFRLTDNDNSSVALLYDVYGKLAGIQMNMLVDELKAKGNVFRFDRVAMYQYNIIEGAAFYTLTAYFQRPDRICSFKRSASEYKHNEIGNVLYFQNGVNKYIKAPDNRRDASKLRIWSENNCYPAMGYHSFYSVETWGDAACTEIVPVFLLFDGDGSRLGFGFDVVGIATSPKYEHPGFTNIAAIVGEMMPQCTEDVFTVGVSILYTYFTSNPEQIICT